MAKNLVLLQLNSVLDSSEKIKISPIGDFEGIDGRKYSLNPDVVIPRLQRNGVDIVLDKNHDDDEAMGWFALDSLEKREDGIYASLELTPKGKELVANRTYRYLSPAYVINWDIHLNDVMCIDRIASVGLVNRPNLLAQALNKDENQKSPALAEGGLGGGFIRPHAVILSRRRKIHAVKSPLRSGGGLGVGKVAAATQKRRSLRLAIKTLIPNLQNLPTSPYAVFYDIHKKLSI